MYLPVPVSINSTYLLYLPCFGSRTGNQLTYRYRPVGTNATLALKKKGKRRDGEKEKEERRKKDRQILNLSNFKKCTRMFEYDKFEEGGGLGTVWFQTNA